MKKKLIRLTESDLHSIIKEVLKKTFNGYSWDIDLNDLFNDISYETIEKIEDEGKRNRFFAMHEDFSDGKEGGMLFKKLSNLHVAVDANFESVGRTPYDDTQEIVAYGAHFFDEEKEELVNIINSYQGNDITNGSFEQGEMEEFKQILISSLDKAITEYDDFFDFEEYYNRDFDD